MKPIFWVVVITFVAFIFYAWGMQAGSGNDPQLNVASVDGVAISRMDYDEALNRYLDQLRERNGGSIPADEEAAARQGVLDELIRRTVELQEAADMGIVVTDEELLQFIKYAEPSFRNEQGQFDAGRFDMYRTKMPAQQWLQLERERREQLMLYKLQDAIVSNLRTSQSDLQNYYSTYYRQFDLAQILIKPELYVSDSRVLAYYQEHRADFAQPLRVHARHILLAAPKGSDAELISRQRTKAENIREMLLKKQLEFARAAQQYSEDSGSRAAGGDLGTFGKGAMVAEFEAAAFAATPGTLTGVVQTDFGFHVIEVLERFENEPFPLEKVRDGIRRRLVGDAERALARAKAEQAVAELKAGRPFAEVARRYSGAASAAAGGNVGLLARFLDPMLFDTEKFESLDKELIRNSFIISQVSEQLDAIPVGGYSQPIRSAFGYHIVSVRKKQDADMAHYEEFRTQVERELNSRLQQDIFTKWYESRRAARDVKIFLTDEELHPLNGVLAPIATPGNAPAPQM